MNAPPRPPESAAAGEIEGLVARIEASGDAAAVGEARELVRGVLALHKEGLARVLEIAREADAASLLKKLADDPIVAGLLVLHDLHPDSFEARARAAVERLAVEHPGLMVESLAGGAVKLRFAGGGVAAALVARIAEAELAEALPDATSVEVAEVVEDSLIRLRRKDGT